MLISRTLPANESGTCVSDGVVIADPAHALHLARIMRRMVIETHRAELAGQDRPGKTAQLFEYLRSEGFRTELAALVESGSKLTEMLESERQDHERRWSKRQQAPF